MSAQTSDKDALESVIRSLIDRTTHQQACIASIFEHLSRLNQIVETIADDNPHLSLPVQTSSPYPRKGDSERREAHPTIVPLEDDVEGMARFHLANQKKKQKG